MRIWIVNPFDQIPGETDREGRYWALASELAKRGHSVIWWTSSFNHFRKANRTAPSVGGLPFIVRLIDAPPYARNVSLKRLANHRLFARGFFETARRGLENGEIEVPDRMIISLPPLDVPEYAFRIRDRYGTKIVLDLQDAWPEAFYRVIPGRGSWHQTISRVLFTGYKKRAIDAIRRADAITAVARTYLDVYGADKHSLPTHVTPIGIRLRELDAGRRTATKSAFPLCFAYVGSISANYDLDTLVEAAAVLKSEGTEFRIRIAGQGPKLEALKKAVDRSRLGDRIEFFGYLPFEQMATLLAGSHVALNPIVPESFSAMPNKVGDYLAAGLPIINSVRGELADFLKDHDAGEYYAARSAHSLAAAMFGYVQQPEKAARQGQNARRLAESMFDRDVTYPELAGFVEELRERQAK